MSIRTRFQLMSSGFLFHYSHAELNYLQISLQVCVTPRFVIFHPNVDEYDV